MTPKRKFTHWARVNITAFLAIFAQFIVADIWTPLMSDFTVMCVVTPVSSRASGYVSRAHIHSNSQVKKDNLLYEPDPTPPISKAEATQIALEQAKLSNQQLSAQIASTRVSLHTAQSNVRNDKTTFDRYQHLSAMQSVSQPDLDKVRIAWQISEQLAVALNASIQNLLIQHNERDNKHNVTLQKYRSTLEGTQLNLDWSRVYAQTDGTVSNLQLSPGFYTATTAPLLVLASHRIDIVADFREKGLRHTKVDTGAAVVLDTLPGKALSARVTSSNAGILVGQEQVNSQLSQLGQSTRWVRDAQHMRIRVALNKLLDTSLPTGAYATVQLYNSEGMFARTFAGAQIHLASWPHCVY